MHGKPMSRRSSAFLPTALSAALAACSSNDAGGAATDSTVPAVSQSSTSEEPVASSPSAPVGSSGDGVEPSPVDGPSGDGGSGGTGAGATSTGGSGSAGATGGSPSGEGPSGGAGAAGAQGSGAASANGGTGGSGVGGSLPNGGSSANGGNEAVGGALGVGGSGSGADPASGGAGGSPEPVSFATCPDDTWNLIWGDDFDGAAGSAVDGSKWAYDSGPNWYNGELQYYSTGADNASLDGNGNLVIEARQESREGRQYTSARLKTEGRQTFTYGRFEGRMKLPYGQGMWPALWMLGGNSWPNDGEIDIMENLGREPTISHGTIHGPGYSGADGPGESFTLPDGAVFSDDFHTFAVEWEPEEIRWYVDGEHFSTKTPADIGGNRWVFDHPFFIILNLAVGGEWPGNPDETTVFPQRLIVDYVRVCQQ